jgi:hypothetical protein
VLRKPRNSSKTFRRLLTALVVFGVVVILDLVLFGWLIFRSLSQREIERVLLETRREAAEVAGRIEDGAAQQGDDLYKVITVERGVRTYIESDLVGRGMVNEVSVYDSEGALVFKARQEVHRPEVGESDEDDGTDLEIEEIPIAPEALRTEENEVRYEYMVEQPIGEFGKMTLAPSQPTCGEVRAGKSWTWTGAEITAQGMPRRLPIWRSIWVPRISSGWVAAMAASTSR